jgi:hypothetical protein
MTMLNDLLTSYVGTVYVIRIFRTDRLIERGGMVYGAPPLPPVQELLTEFHRAPQPPQGGTGGMDEVTPASIRAAYGPGKYIVEIYDSRRRLSRGAVGLEIP